MPLAWVDHRTAGPNTINKAEKSMPTHHSPVSHFWKSVPMRQGARPRRASPAAGLRAVIHAASVMLLVFCAVSPVAAHHDSDPVFSPPQAPNADARLVAAVGIVQELVVDNRVSGIITRYVALRLDDGSTVPLRGTALDGLLAGQRVEATGTPAGTTIFVTATRNV